MGILCRIYTAIKDYFVDTVQSHRLPCPCVPPGLHLALHDCYWLDRFVLKGGLQVKFIALSSLDIAHLV